MSDLQKIVLFLSYLSTLSGGHLIKPKDHSKQSADGATTAMLNAMEQLMTGGDEFDPVFRDRLYMCMDKINSQMREVADLGWAGMIQYSDAGGVPGDTWGGMETNWIENNATAQEFHNMVIYEPCNYASNLAYYHVATMICDHWDNFSMDRESVTALGEIFTNHGMGSSFLHGSHTRLGGNFDVTGIDVFAFIVYQAAVKHLPNYNNPIIKDLQPTPRTMTGVEASNIVTAMIQNEQVWTWNNTLNSLDVPEEFTTFAGIICTVCTMVFEDETVDNLVDLLFPQFGLSDELYDFITLQYLPELRLGLANINIGPVEKLQLETNGISMAIKMLYAFLWQEEYFTTNPMFLEPEVNAAGNAYLPLVNDFANTLNNWPIYEIDMQHGLGAFPAIQRCDDVNPHSKWHIESAAGLIDMILLSDDIFRLTQ